MSPYSRDFLWRHCIFNYNGYYSSLTYEHLFLDSELSTCFYIVYLQSYSHRMLLTLLTYNEYYTRLWMVSGVSINFNCFTFIPMIVFVITLTFIKVVRNKCLNGASVTAIRVVIYPFTSKKVEWRKNYFSTRHSARLCRKPGVHDKRHDTIYLDYSQVLNTPQILLTSNSTHQWLFASTKVHNRIHSWVFPTH